MVLNHNDKRKRKEGDLVDLVDPLSGSPKRPKVHAQRKFAQGTATIFNPTVSPVKEKEKIKPSVFTELITHRRPNTEDFLTFLCFRGTSILPPRLNFFNVGAKKEKNDAKPSSGNAKNAQLSSSRTSVAENNKTNSAPKSTAKTKSNISMKKAVDTVIHKSMRFKSTTIQALKKKYQEQRFAKQRIKNKLTSSNVIKTRSRSEQPIIKSISKSPPRKFPPKVEIKRHGLRSGGRLEKIRGVPKSKFRSTMKPKTEKKGVNKKEEKKKKVEVKESSTSSSMDEQDEDSEEEEEKPAKRVEKSSKKIATRSKTEEKKRRVEVKEKEPESPTFLSMEEDSEEEDEKPVKRVEKSSKKVCTRSKTEDKKKKIETKEKESSVSSSSEELDEDSEEEEKRAKRAEKSDRKVPARRRMEMRRVTRSQREEAPPAQGNASKRPTRKTKEAAAVYMEILGRKLVSPEFENEDDNISLDSFPELPNARRIERTENEIKARVTRLTARSAAIDEKNKSRVPVKRFGKNVEKDEKSPPVKNKRQLSLKRYCEVETEEESESSSSESDKRPSTRRSAMKTEPDANRNLRSSARKLTNSDIVTTKKDDSDCGKLKNDSPPTKATSKEKVLPVKKKRAPEKQRKVESTEETCGSEEETLGEILTKMKEKKDAKKSTKESKDEAKSGKKEDEKKGKDVKDVKMESKISDDDESFKGFTEKAVISCDTPDNANLLEVVEDSGEKDEDKATLEASSPKEESNEPHFPDEKSAKDSEKPSEQKEDKFVEIPEGVMIMPPQSPVHGWKERLNLSTERIERWLTETSLAKEEKKIDIDIAKHFQFKSPAGEKKTHLSISTKIQHLVRPVNVTLSKLMEKIPKAAKPSKALLLDPKIPQTIALELKNLEAESMEAKDSASVKSSASTESKKQAASPRKLFQPKIKERKVGTPNANAFSAENESSVYAFESDNETTPVSTPFRRKLKDGKSSLAEANSGANDPEETGERSLEATTSSQIKLPLSYKVGAHSFELPKSFANLANMQVLPLDKLSTSWSDVNCSSSIAVQVNLDEQAQESNDKEDKTEESQKSIEISTQTDLNNENNDDDDDNGHLFYIPLQAVTRNGSNLVQGQQFIQGVAVKFGTEGPNQRVMLKAKLVTKPSHTMTRCPPVGTVQPTTRIPAGPALEAPVPSTSASSAAPSLPSSPSTSNLQQVSGVSNSSVPSNQQSVNSTATTPTPSEKSIKSPKVARERKSLGDSAKTKRYQAKSKAKAVEVYSPTNNTSFPDTKNSAEKARLVEAPTFHPSEKDFQDPLEYFDKIRPIAEKFGICRVVPPANFKPECKVSDDMRFTAYNQYVHRMLHRWGLNVKEMMAIKKYLATQSITLTQPPWIGGMEVDLPHLYQTVQVLGGLKEVIEKKKWQKVADGMKIPRSAQDRVAKLDDIYCKYLLPYDTLSPEEREKLFEDVEAEWKIKESRALQRQDAQSNDEDEEDDDSSDEIEECIVKGRNMPLNAFYRIARNTQRMWFGENQRSGNEAEGASAEEVETAFWKHVSERKRHVCVHNASIDSSGRGFGFSVAKNSPFARHPWNLKVLTNNASSVLRALGPLMGVTVPTLHVGMLFSACCWYRDPHGLPWIEYLHTGAKKIWYGIPDEQNDNFREALTKMVPRYCQTKTIWLPSDTAMVPPDLLVENGVPLCHTVQEPGQFIVVFPKAFTSSICTGYVVSESVYFAQLSWLETAEQVFKDINDSCEPSIFSFERLLVSIINDTKTQLPVLRQILPSVKLIWEKEMQSREELEKLGLTKTEKLPLPESGKRGKGKKVAEDDGDFECENCRANLFLSLVSNNQDDSVYCLLHALQLLQNKKLVVKNCVLMYTYDNDELRELVCKLEDRIEAKSKKTNQTKQVK